MLFLRNIVLYRVREKRHGFHPDFNLIFTEPIAMNSIKSTLSKQKPIRNVDVDRVPTAFVLLAKIWSNIISVI